MNALTTRRPSRKRRAAVVAATATAALLLVPPVPAGAAPAGTLDPTFATGGVLHDPAHRTVTSLAASGPRTFVATEPSEAAAPGEHEVLALTEAGGLDPTFGTDGSVAITDPADGRQLNLDRAPGGAVYVSRDAGAEWRISKLDATGAPDPSFGVAGTVALSFGAGALGLNWRTQAVDAAGVITIAGLAAGNEPPRALVLLRLGADGAPVASFGNGGLAAFPLDANLVEGPVDLAVDGEGRAVVVIETGDSQRGTHLLRFGADGLLDRSFGAGGFAIPTRGMHATRVAVDATGRTVMLGTQPVLGDPYYDAIPVVGRLDANGVPDLGFAFAGIFGLPHVPGLYASGQDLAVDGAGRPLLTFAAATNANVLTGVIRLDPDGVPDPTFGFGGGTGGVAAWPLLTQFTALAVDAQGRALLGTSLVLPNTACPPSCGELLVLRLRAT